MLITTLLATTAISVPLFGKITCILSVAIGILACILIPSDPHNL